MSLPPNDLGWEAYREKAQLLWQPLDQAKRG